jgi:hypothetical protein
MTLLAQKSIKQVSEVPTHLHHPGLRGIAGAASQLHRTSGQIEHKQ